LTKCFRKKGVGPQGHLSPGRKGGQSKEDNETKTVWESEGRGFWGPKWYPWSSGGVSERRTLKTTPVEGYEMDLHGVYQ